MPRDEVEAAIHAARDLGPEYQPAVVESIVERIDESITARIDARVAERLDGEVGKDDGSGNRLTLAIVSLGTGIPLTAIAGGVADFPGVLVTWAGIAAVNFAHSWRPGRSPRR